MPGADVTQNGDTKVAAKRPGAWVFFGTPDQRRAKAGFVAWDRPPGYVVPGTAAFYPELEALPFGARAVHFGGGPMPSGVRIPRMPAINFMADADLHVTTLRQAAHFAAQLKAPCFNAPEAVLATGRADVAQRLRGIPGLEVPRTVKVRENRITGLQAAMERAGMVYPVIARLPGDQGGVSTYRIDGPGGWEQLHCLPWGGNDLYLTQYVDYRDADGLFRKLRLAVVGKKIIVKHRYASRGWMVHFRARAPGTDGEERDFLESFESRVLPGVGETVLAVADRLRLDYFGIDASLRPDGRLLLFEANATMSMLDSHAAAGDMWHGPTESIRRALVELLSNPRGWREQGG